MTVLIYISEVRLVLLSRKPDERQLTFSITDISNRASLLLIPSIPPLFVVAEGSSSRWRLRWPRDLRRSDRVNRCLSRGVVNAKDRNTVADN